MGLHVSTLLSHLQALVYQIYTKNALRIVGSPTLTITKNKVQKIQITIQTTCKLDYLCKVEYKIYSNKERNSGSGGAQVCTLWGQVHEGLKMTQQSRNMQSHYHIICLILPLLCLTELHAPFISQTLRDGTPQVLRDLFNFIDTLFSQANS